MLRLGPRHLCQDGFLLWVGYCYRPRGLYYLAVVGMCVTLCKLTVLQVARFPAFLSLKDHELALTLQHQWPLS